jgi:hypothetical protein
VSSGLVIQEAVSTGNPEFDKQVNKFYGCISKITHEPQEPGKAEDDNCYFQIFGGSINNSNRITLPSNQSPSSVSNNQGSNENSGQGSTNGNSGQIVSEAVHGNRKAIQVIETYYITYSIGTILFTLF